MFAPILSGFTVSVIFGILFPIWYHKLQVHHPHGFGTLSQVVCHIWCIYPSSPNTKTLSLPLNTLLNIEWATGAWVDVGALYPVLSHETHLSGPDRKILRVTDWIINVYCNITLNLLVCQVLYMYLSSITAKASKYLKKRAVIIKDVN